MPEYPDFFQYKETHLSQLQGTSYFLVSQSPKAGQKITGLWLDWAVVDSVLPWAITFFLLSRPLFLTYTFVLFLLQTSFYVTVKFSNWSNEVED